jgi:Na+-driven multidrug efflux pump
MGLLLVVFSKEFLSLFTRDADVIHEGMYRLTIMGLSYCVSAFMDCTIAASRSLGKSAVPMVIVIMGSCVFRVFWMYTIFAHFQTISSIYLLYIFSWTITAVAEILYFVYIWKNKAH